MSDKSVKVILGLFILLASLPIFQLLFHPFKPVGLSGAFEVTVPPNYSWKGFKDGKYQQHAELFIKDNTPFKGDFVRFRNQLNYFVFNEINTNLSLGKGNYIFDPNYVKALEATDIHSDSLFQSNVGSMKQGMDLLRQLNLPLLVVFAPNKANFYQEYLPQPLKKSVQTNSTRYKQAFIENQVPLMDVDAWYMQMKDTTKSPLIPKYGAHWSTYGGCLAADSVQHYLRKLGVELPGFQVMKMEYSTQARMNDDDYLPSLNLIWRWKSPELAYPVLGFEQTEKADVLVISDSFFWTFYDLGLMSHCFGENSQLWYYNKTKFDANRENIGECNGRITLNELKKYKAIILLSAQPSLTNFAFGFFNQLPIPAQKP